MMLLSIISKLLPECIYYAPCNLGKASLELMELIAHHELVKEQCTIVAVLNAIIIGATSVWKKFVVLLNAAIESLCCSCCYDVAEKVDDNAWFSRFVEWTVRSHPLSLKSTKRLIVFFISSSCDWSYCLKLWEEASTKQTWPYSIPTGVIHKWK